jgi:hypothetical protein
VAEAEISVAAAAATIAHLAGKPVGKSSTVNGERLERSAFTIHQTSCLLRGPDYDLPSSI